MWRVEPKDVHSKQICLYPMNELFSGFSVGFCVNEEKVICSLALMTTRAFSRNIGKLFSKLKLVTDNLFREQLCLYPINEWKLQRWCLLVTKSWYILALEEAHIVEHCGGKPEQAANMHMNLHAEMMSWISSVYECRLCMALPEVISTCCV